MPVAIHACDITLPQARNDDASKNDTTSKQGGSHHPALLSLCLVLSESDTIYEKI